MGKAGTASRNKTFLAQRMARRKAMRTVTDIDGSFLLSNSRPKDDKQTNYSHSQDN